VFFWQFRELVGSGLSCVFLICHFVPMPRRRAASSNGGYSGDVFYLRNFYCRVKLFNGTEWRDTVFVMTSPNDNKFTLSMVARQVVRKMELPTDRTLCLDDSMHSYAPLPSSLGENQIYWYFIEEFQPSAVVCHSES